MSLFARAVFAFLVLPGVVAFVIPIYWIDRQSLIIDVPGLLLLGGGLAILLWCVRDFYVAGKGTLAPWSPPENLVVIGLYRYCRNPMYVGVLTILVGWAVAFRSADHAIYALAMAVVFAVRVIAFEEPFLARTYGDTWVRYRNRVPRWLPGSRMNPLLIFMLVALLGTVHSAVAQPALDFATFRDRVQPIFLHKKAGLARCYVCHSQGTPFRLQRLSPGKTMWTEEESRKNFEAVQRLVVSGKPEASRLLLMPLEHEAGGTEFHPGGKRWASQNDPEWKQLAEWIRTPAPIAQGTRPIIVQTNAAGDNIHVIDPATNTVVGEIGGIEVNHGVAAAPDGSRFYVTNEAEHTLDVVDGKTLKVIKQIPLSDRPNNLSISLDGRRVYVAIIAAPGGVDVIDTATFTRSRTIPTKGGIHNTFVTPDGKHVIAGSIAGRNITVIDTATEQPAWTLSFDNGVRPIGFDRNADGSTRRMFVQISNFHGFYVVDFAERREVSRVALPELPKEQQNWDTLQGSPSHGIAATPDGRQLWVCSKVNHAVYAYSLPDLKLLGAVEVGHHPDWLTFTPDSRRVYVANAGSNSVSVVDIETRKEIGRVPVGQVPKRNITAVWAR